MKDCRDARTKKEQEAITPKKAVEMLKTGNKRFVDDKMENYCYEKMAKQTAENGQFPFAAIVACVDSRIPVESVFDQAIGDMFVARVAGNFINTDIVGSLEFAVHSGVKVIMILGHTSCGAVKAACSGGVTPFSALNSMLSNLQTSVKSAVISTGKEATAEDPLFVQAAADVNVKIAMADLRNQSTLIDEAVKKGDLALIGRMYDLKTRSVDVIMDKDTNEPFC